MTTELTDDLEERPLELDLWLAFVAGDRVWIDDGAVPGLAERTVAAVQQIAMGALLTILGLAMSLAPGEPTTFEIAWFLGGLAAGLALAVRPVRVAMGRPSTQVGYRLRVVWRTAAYLALIFSCVALLSGWALLAAWPLGVFMGNDVVQSTWALGLPSTPRRWWFRFLVSPVHLGVLGVLTAAVLSGSYPEVVLEVVIIYLSMHLAFLVAGVMVRSAGRFAAALDRLAARAAASAVERERRHRAHWLHDDVLSEVRLTALRVGTGAVSPEQVASELQELDHRLRLRQLDEMYVGGQVRAADVLQPQLRRVQSLGIALGAVPSVERVGFAVDESTGRLLGRVLAGFTSNAVNAGATRLSYDVEVVGDDIVVAVTDDAGGFDFECIPAGRGLEQLVADLGPGRLERRTVPGGSTMIAHLPRHGTPPDAARPTRSADGQDPPR